MDHSTTPNVILGSKLALAMSMVVGSPVRRPSGDTANRRSVELAEIEKRCEELKSRSLRLLEAMEHEETRIAFDIASIRSPIALEATKRVSKVMEKLVKKQLLLNSQMANLLDTMMQKLRVARDPNS